LIVAAAIVVYMRFPPKKEQQYGYIQEYLDTQRMLPRFVSKHANTPPNT
jgi:hypothetical protein